MKKLKSLTKFEKEKLDISFSNKINGGKIFVSSGPGEELIRRINNGIYYSWKGDIKGVKNGEKIFKRQRLL